MTFNINPSITIELFFWDLAFQKVKTEPFVSLIRFVDNIGHLKIGGFNLWVGETQEHFYPPISTCTHVCVRVCLYACVPMCEPQGRAQVPFYKRVFFAKLGPPLAQSFKDKCSDWSD